MKKRNLTKMALLGLAHGLLLNGQVSAASDIQNIEALMASNPTIFNELSQEARSLLSHLDGKEVSNTLLAASCGNKTCSAVASKCGSKCQAVASNSKANGCSAVASSCGSKCSHVASSCGSKCSHIASSCGSKCSHIADRAAPTLKLQDPSTLAPKPNSSKSSGTKTDNYKEIDPNSENLNYFMMSEDDLLLELNDEGVRLYKSLSPEGKKLAREVASQRCNGTNECKGLNACQTDKNDCAGKGGCKGQSKCAISDKNMAVKLVVEKMAAKRNGALNSK